MATTLAFAPSRALLQALNPGRKHTMCTCLEVTRSQHRHNLRSRRYISSASAQSSEMEVDGKQPPRWAQTPPAMKAPYPTKEKSKDWQPYKCNNDPRRLDEVYVNFLGPNGDRLLSEETKWLAVTHKSFDHGRRGFNDRMAFLGRRIVELQLSLGLLNAADSSGTVREWEDPHGRLPFVHPATSNVEVLSGDARNTLLYHVAVSKLAASYGIPSVVRWQPKDTQRLDASGCQMVYSQAVFAIIGALAMEQGAVAANTVALERVLTPLAMRQGMQQTIAAAP